MVMNIHIYAILLTVHVCCLLANSQNGLVFFSPHETEPEIWTDNDNAFIKFLMS